MVRKSPRLRHHIVHDGMSLSSMRLTRSHSEKTLASIENSASARLNRRFVSFIDTLMFDF